MTVIRFPDSNCICFRHAVDLLPHWKRWPSLEAHTRTAETGGEKPAAARGPGEKPAGEAERSAQGSTPGEASADTGAPDQHFRLYGFSCGMLILSEITNGS